MPENLETNVITINTKPDSMPNPCENTGKEKKWTKTCPKCGTEQRYASRVGLWKAKKSNTFCHKCRHSLPEYKQKLSKAQTGVPNIACRKKPFESTYNALIRNSKIRNIPCTLTYEDYIEFTKTSNCHYCNGIIEWQSFHGDRDNRKMGSNLDRINNDVGYIKNNCCVCCTICNSVKNKHFNYDEMIEIGKTIKTLRERKYNGTN